MGATEEIQNDSKLYKELDPLLNTALLASEAVEKLTQSLTRNLVAEEEEFGVARFGSLGLDESSSHGGIGESLVRYIRL
jgi:hypothetical protein